jgi:LacI family transcriptional regulator
MARKRVSIIDIAKELNLSPSTVSRALRDESRIAPKTREAVRSLADKLGYRPNPQARSLLNHRTYTVGLVVPDFIHPFFSTVLTGVESVLTEAGFQLMICTSHGSSDKERKAVNLLSDARVDGLLVSFARETTDFEHFERLRQEGIPVVFFDRLAEDLDASYVINDDFHGAALAVEHLIQLGRRRIGHVKGPEHISTTFNRYVGYRETLRRHQLPVSPEWVFQADDDKGKRILDTDHLKEMLPELDGLFVFNDYIAYEIIRLIRECGLRIPEDIALVGFGNDPFGIYAYPTLTTIDQPAYEMGEASARMLLDHIYSDPAHFQPKSCILATQLIVRESSGGVYVK